LENELNFEIINVMLVLLNELMPEPKKIENLKKTKNKNSFQSIHCR
jgi:hypothetical protein